MEKSYLVFKSTNLYKLNLLKQALYTEVPCYRITDIEVLEYKSEVPFEVFKEKLKYIPLPEVMDFINKEINNSSEQSVSYQSSSTELTSYNQGNLNLKFTITKGTGLDHPGFNTIKDMEWIPEEGILRITPNIHYIGNLEVAKKLNELSKRFPEVEFPELRPDLRIPAINTVVNTIKWLPYVQKIYIFGSRARGDNEERAGIDIAVECPNATDKDWRFIKYLLRESSGLTDVYYTKVDTAKKEYFNDNIVKDLVLLYSRNKSIDQIKEYGNYQVFKEEAGKLCCREGRDDDKLSIITFLESLKYLPFVKEAYHFVRKDPTKRIQYYDIMISCPDATEEDWSLLRVILVSGVVYMIARCYRLEELLPKGNIMKLFKKTKTLIARRS